MRRNLRSMEALPAFRLHPHRSHRHHCHEQAPEGVAWLRVSSLNSVLHYALKGDNISTSKSAPA